MAEEEIVYAELDSDNKVINMTVVMPENAPDEATGIAWLKVFFDTTNDFKLVSSLPKATNPRKMRPYDGCVYDATNDWFMPPKPVKYDMAGNIIVPADSDRWEFDTDAWFWDDKDDPANRTTFPDDFDPEKVNSLTGDQVYE